MINLKEFVKIKVSQLANKNQFIIGYCDDKRDRMLVAFQSYQSLIAIYDIKEHKFYLNWCKWDYSKTTLKHLKKFVNEYVPNWLTYESKQQFIGLIKKGDIILFEDR